MKILIIEDDSTIAFVIKTYLKKKILSLLLTIIYLKLKILITMT